MDARNPKAQVTKSLRIYLDTNKDGKADTVNIYVELVLCCSVD